MMQAWADYLDRLPEDLASEKLPVDSQAHFDADAGRVVAPNGFYNLKT
jgi:hypothetical protein